MYIAITEMKQARSQAHNHLLHSGNAETGAGQPSPAMSGQTQSHTDRWPPPGHCLQWDVHWARGGKKR